MWGRAPDEAKRLGFVFLLLVAVLVRAAVPSGWMPNLDGAPGGDLVICTGAGETVLHRKDAPASPHHAGRHDVCAFSGLSSAPIAEAPALHAPALFDHAAANAPTRAGWPPSSPGHREQAARAPPRLI